MVLGGELVEKDVMVGVGWVVVKLCEVCGVIV